MRIQIDIPDDKRFKDRLNALADSENRSRKNWLEHLIIYTVNNTSTECECENSMSSYMDKTKTMICGDCYKPYPDKRTVQKKQGGSNNA